MQVIVFISHVRQTIIYLHFIFLKAHHRKILGTHNCIKSNLFTKEIF